VAFPPKIVFVDVPDGVDPATIPGAVEVTAEFLNDFQDYVISIVSGGGVVADATTSSKGVVELAGDLGGTATAPTVPALTNMPTTGDMNAAIATATANMVWDLQYDGTNWPVRPNTSGTSQRVYWWGPSATPVPTTGTASGGTRAAAPNDKVFLS
jgi:hypothetical protein